MIVPDTSIWIEFFKQNENYYKRLSALLENRQILAVEPVFAELFFGIRRDRDRNLVVGYWEVLPKLPFAAGALVSAAHFANSQNYHNQGVGLMDAAILKPVIAGGHQIWTLDKKMLRLVPEQHVYR